MSEATEATSMDGCEFYHSMDIPGYGEVQGQWDLRGRVVEYLGNTDVSGKKVLDVGTSSGFLCFEMEKMGASVTAFDLSPDHDWDFVPYGGASDAGRAAAMKGHLERVRQGWKLLHERTNSSARLVLGSVYDLPGDEIGEVDISLFGDIVLHLRDPFRALEQAAKLTAETIIVTDIVPPCKSSGRGLLERLLGRLCHRFSVRNRPTAFFVPDPPSSQNDLTWWYISPVAVVRFLNVLDFPDSRVSHHSQYYVPEKRMIPHYTVVASR